MQGVLLVDMNRTAVSSSRLAKDPTRTYSKEYVYHVDRKRWEIIYQPKTEPQPHRSSGEETTQDRFRLRGARVTTREHFARGRRSGWIDGENRISYTGLEAWWGWWFRRRTFIFLWALRRSLVSCVPAGGPGPLRRPMILNQLVSARNAPQGHLKKLNDSVQRVGGQMANWEPRYLCVGGSPGRWQHIRVRTHQSHRSPDPAAYEGY